MIDASGTWNKLGQEVALARIAQAGIILITGVAVGAELQEDWRNASGRELGPIWEHLPFYGNFYGSFLAAKRAGKAG